MKKGVRPVRLKIENPLPIYWNDAEDLENKIDYSELFNDYAKTYHEDIVIPVIEILPDESTQLAPFKLPKKLIKFGEEEVLRHAKENEYDLDEADEAFLAEAKEYAGEDGAPPFRFAPDSFERIMDYFEKESFQQREHEQVVLEMQPSMLLKANRFRASWHVRDKKPIATAEQKPDSEKEDNSVECLGASMPVAGEASDAELDDEIGHDPDEDALCCICGEGDSDAANKIVFCEGCNVAVHQQCQSLASIPEGDWFCCVCEHVKASPHLKASNIRCFQCNQSGGSMRITTEGAWVHIACAIFINEMKVTKEGTIQLIDHKIHMKRAKLVCSLCGLSGGCVQCCQKGCFASYHVTCCLNNGQYHSVKFNKTASDHLITSSATLCPNHTSKRLEQAQREKREAIPAQIGRFVSDKATKKWVKSLVSAKIPDEAYDDIANYWKNKRSQINAGRSPLIRRLLIETDDERHRQALGDRKRTQFILPGTNQEKFDAMKKLRKNFEQARILVDMMHRRELKKLEIVNHYRAAVTTFYLHLPLSSQFIQQHPEIFELNHPTEIVIADGEDEETNIQCFDVDKTNEIEPKAIKPESNEIVVKEVEVKKEEELTCELQPEGMEVEETRSPVGSQNVICERDEAMASEMSLEALGEIKAEERGNENNHVAENGAHAKKNLNSPNTSQARKPRLRLLSARVNPPSPLLSASGSRLKQPKLLTAPPLTVLVPLDNAKHQQKGNEHAIRIEPNAVLQKKILARDLARFQARNTTFTTLAEIQQQTLVIDSDTDGESDVKTLAPHPFFLPRASSSSHYIGAGQEEDDKTYKLSKKRLSLSSDSPGRAMRTRLRAANGQAEEVIDVDLKVMSISNKRIEAKINSYGLLPDYELERVESIRKKEKSSESKKKSKKEKEKSSSRKKDKKKDKKKEHSERSDKKRSRSDGEGDSSTRAKKKLKKEHKKNRESPSKNRDKSNEVIDLDSSSESMDLEVRKKEREKRKEKERKKEKERRKEKERKKSSNSKKEKNHKKSKDKRRDKKEKKRKSEKENEKEPALQQKESKEEVRKFPSLIITNSNRTNINSTIENSLTNVVSNTNSNFLSNFSTSSTTQSSKLKVKKPKTLKDLSMKARNERPSSLAGDEDRERSQPSLYTYFSLATKPPPLPPVNTNSTNNNDSSSLKMEDSVPIPPQAMKMKITDDDSMASSSSSGEESSRTHVPVATPRSPPNFDSDDGNNNDTASSRSSAESASEEASHGSGDDDETSEEKQNTTGASKDSNSSSESGDSSSSDSEIDEVRMGENRSGEDEEAEGTRSPRPSDASQRSQSSSDQESGDSESDANARSPLGLMGPTALSSSSSESMDEESS